MKQGLGILFQALSEGKPMEIKGLDFMCARPIFGFYLVFWYLNCRRHLLNPFSVRILQRIKLECFRIFWNRKGSPFNFSKLMECLTITLRTCNSDVQFGQFWNADFFLKIILIPRIQILSPTSSERGDSISSLELQEICKMLDFQKIHFCMGFLRNLSVLFEPLFLNVQGKSL